MGDLFLRMIAIKAPQGEIQGANQELGQDAEKLE